MTSPRVPISPCALVAEVVVMLLQLLSAKNLGDSVQEISLWVFQGSEHPPWKNRVVWLGFFRVDVWKKFKYGKTEEKDRRLETPGVLGKPRQCLCAGLFGLSFHSQNVHNSYFLLNQPLQCYLLMSWLRELCFWGSFQIQLVKITGWKMSPE